LLIGSRAGACPLIRLSSRSRFGRLCRRQAQATFVAKLLRIGDLRAALRTIFGHLVCSFNEFWILDFGFWIAQPPDKHATRVSINPKSKI
jgi:hypothetical protein